jgi:hypothetical protein
MTGLWRIVCGPTSKELQAAIAQQRIVKIKAELYGVSASRRTVWVLLVKATNRQRTSVWDIQSFFIYDSPEKTNRIGGGYGGEYDASCADGLTIRGQYVGRLHLDN